MVVKGDYVIFRNVAKIIGYEKVGLKNGVRYEVNAVSALGIDINVGITNGGTWYVTNNESAWAEMELCEEFQTSIEGDARYKEPKKDPIAEDSVVDKVIQENEIYKEAHRLLTEDSQRKQVAYGYDKYVETLNVNSWSTIETIDHIIGESVDNLHYLIMLKMRILAAMENEKQQEG